MLTNFKAVTGGGMTFQGIHRPFTTFSTDSVPVDDRFDYWQDLFVSCKLAKPSGLSKSAFRGSIARYTKSDGSSFSRIEGGPLVCHFGRAETGRKILGIVRSGTIRVRHDNGAVTTLDKRSGLVLLDVDRGLSTASTDYELAQLALPLGPVSEALPQPDEGLVLLPNDGLGPLLRAHLDAMASHSEMLDELDAAAAMQTTTSLAMAFLSRVFGRAEPSVSPFDESVFVAAQCYMEANAARHDLTASGIARAIGCSRAHLYRIFLDRNRSVGGTLRQIRLARARLRIGTELHYPIGTIAFECGYTDQSAFGKAFRRQFDHSPQDCRKMAREGAGGTPSLVKPVRSRT